MESQQTEFNGDKIISVQCAGVFYTMNGKYKVLMVVAKIPETEVKV